MKRLDGSLWARRRRRERLPKRARFKRSALALVGLVVLLSSSSSGKCQRQAANKWPSAQLARVGLVRGARFEPAGSGESVAAFLGVPYAGAPLGPLRFMPPAGQSTAAAAEQPAAQRQLCALANASSAPARVHSSFGPECVRLADWLAGAPPHRATQSEDCLNLNVFVPLADDEQQIARQAHARLTSADKHRGAPTQAEKTIADRSISVSQAARSSLAGAGQVTPRAAPLEATPTALDTCEPLPLAGKPARPVLVVFHASGARQKDETPPLAKANSLAHVQLAQRTNSIVITFNNRIGLLGFLPFMDTEAYVASSESSESALSAQSVRLNHAIWDQIGLLHWLKRNIGAFGGDPSDISLMSADNRAAVQLALLSTSPLAKGLFKRLVLVHDMRTGSIVNDTERASSSIDQLLRSATKWRRAKAKLSDELSLIVRKLLQASQRGERASSAKSSNSSLLFEELEAGDASKVFEFIQLASLSDLAQIELELARIDQRLLTLVSQPNLDDKLLFPHFASVLRPFRPLSAGRYRTTSAQLPSVSWFELLAGQSAPRPLLADGWNASGQPPAWTLQRARERSDYCAYVRRLRTDLDQLANSTGGYGSAASAQLDPLGLLARDLQSITLERVPTAAPVPEVPKRRHETAKGAQAPQELLAHEFKHLKQAHLLQRFLVQKIVSAAGSMSASDDDEDERDEANRRQQQQQRSTQAAQLRFKRAPAIDAPRDAPSRSDFERLVDSLSSFELVAAFFGRPIPARHNQATADLTGGESLAGGHFGAIVRALRLLNGRNELEPRLVELAQLVDLHSLAKTRPNTADKSKLDKGDNLLEEQCNLTGAPARHERSLLMLVGDSEPATAPQPASWLAADSSEIVLHAALCANCAHPRTASAYSRHSLAVTSNGSSDNTGQQASELLDLLDYHLDLMPYLLQLSNDTETIGAADGPPAELVACLGELDSALEPLTVASNASSLLASGQQAGALIGESTFHCLSNTSSRLRAKLRADMAHELELLGKLARQLSTESQHQAARASAMTTRNLANQSEGIAFLEQELAAAREQQQIGAQLVLDEQTRAGSPATLQTANATSANGGGGGGPSRGPLAKTYKDAVGQALAVVIGTGLLIFLLNLVIVLVIALRSARSRARRHSASRAERAIGQQEAQQDDNANDETTQKLHQLLLADTQHLACDELASAGAVAGRKSTLKRKASSGVDAAPSLSVLGNELGHQQQRRSIKFDLIGIESQQQQQQHETCGTASDQQPADNVCAEPGELYLAATIPCLDESFDAQQHAHFEAKSCALEQQQPPSAASLGGSLTSPYDSHSHNTSSSNSACTFGCWRQQQQQQQLARQQRRSATLSLHQQHLTLDAGLVNSPSPSTTMSNATPIQELNTCGQHQQHECAAAGQQHGLNSSISLIYPAQYEQQAPLSSSSFSAGSGHESLARRSRTISKRHHQQQDHLQQAVQLLPLEPTQHQQQLQQLPQTIYYLETSAANELQFE